MNKYHFDRFIKSEIESIAYDGAEKAWDEFEMNSLIEKRTNSYFYYLMPVLVAASITIIMGVLLHQSMTQQHINAVNPELALAGDQVDLSITNLLESTSPNLSKVEKHPTSTSDPIDELTSIETKSINDNSEQSYLPESNVNPVIVDKDHTRFLHSVDDITLEGSRKHVPSIQSDGSHHHPRSIVPLKLPNLISILKFGNLEISPEFANKEVEMTLIHPKRELHIFGEFGIGNNQSGSRLITGLSIPMNTWSIEAGIGLNAKYNRSLFFNQEIESISHKDFNEYHDYTFTQKLNIILPIRVKKRVWRKHSIVTGIQGVFNLTNQVDIESVVPQTTRQYQPGFSNGIGSAVDFSREVYKYNNITSASNSYSVVNANRFNLDVLAGYEFDLNQFSIGGTFSKPVFSIFQVSRTVDSPVQANILENSSFNISLKYRLI